METKIAGIITSILSMLLVFVIYKLKSLEDDAYNMKSTRVEALGSVLHVIYLLMIVHIIYTGYCFYKHRTFFIRLIKG